MCNVMAGKTKDINLLGFDTIGILYTDAYMHK